MRLYLRVARDLDLKPGDESGIERREAVRQAALGLAESRFFDEWGGTEHALRYCFNRDAYCVFVNLFCPIFSRHSMARRCDDAPEPDRHP